jgi:hypothetical protein
MLYNHMSSRSGTTGPLAILLSKNSVSPHPRNKKESLEMEDCCKYIAAVVWGLNFFLFFKLTCCHCLVVSFDTSSTGDTKYCHSEGRNYIEYWSQTGTWGSVVVKALRYKSEGPGIDSRRRRGFSLASDSFMCPGVDSASKNEYQVNPGGKGGRWLRLTTYHFHGAMSRNLGA